MKIPTRQELTVKPGRAIGFLVKENIGIAVYNDWGWLPWYRKMLRKRFYTDLWRRLFHKRREEYYGGMPPG
jgi:hypothetical protein